MMEHDQTTPSAPIKGCFAIISWRRVHPSSAEEGSRHGHVDTSA